MRYGVIGDVHGNLAALEVAVRRLRALGVDGWICAGDLVGYGPQPNECVAAVAGLGALCVAGNHDLMAVGALPEERAGALARRTLAWTRDVLRPEHAAYLAGLPRTAGAPGLLVAHGSPADPQEYVQRAARAAALLGALAADPATPEVLVLGHTHRRWLYSAARGTLAAPHGLGARRCPAPPPGDRVLLNPGAVGQSRNLEVRPRARFALLDLEARTVRFLAADYDVVAARRAAVAAGLPARVLHRRPKPVRRAARRAAAALTAAAARA